MLVFAIHGMSGVERPLRRHGPFERGPRDRVDALVAFYAAGLGGPDGSVGRVTPAPDGPNAAVANEFFAHAGPTLPDAPQRRRERQERDGTGNRASSRPYAVRVLETVRRQHK